MDSLTQAVLGAAVGEAVAGRQAGRRAVLWGAAFGTLPDLDVLANPFLSEAAALAFHRSLTHSIFFSLAAAPLFGLLLARWQRRTSVSWQRWSMLALLALATHWMVDCLNTYGTQIFYPFSDYPVSLGALFIIDPLYTVPIFAGLIVALLLPRNSRRRRIANYAGLAVSTLYIGIALLNKSAADEVFTAAFARAGIQPEQMLTTPMPLNTILWAGMARQNDTVYVGLYSLLDGHREIAFHRIPRYTGLISRYQGDPVLERLFWFSRGFYAAREENGATVMKDLRFGRSDLWLGDGGDYLFSFRLVLAPASGRLIDIDQATPSFDIGRDLLGRYWERVLGEP